MENFRWLPVSDTLKHKPVTVWESKFYLGCDPIDDSYKVIPCKLIKKVPMENKVIDENNDVFEYFINEDKIVYYRFVYSMFTKLI